MCDDVPSLRGLLQYWKETAVWKLQEFWRYRILKQPRPVSPLSIFIITREALKIIEQNLTFTEAFDKDYERRVGNINIRRPIRFGSGENR